MGDITEKPWFRKFLVSLVGKPRLRRFEKASKQCRATQDAVLNDIITANKDTAFGKDHGFASIKTIEDYQKAVPVSGFGRHRPYVERMCKGEADILFPGRPLFYNTTSGTTAKPKMIPVSKEYFENAYSGMSRLWLYTCLKDNPHIYDGRSLSVVSPAVEGHVEDGTPYGAISGMLYRNIPKVLKSTHATPYPLICIKDYAKKYYSIVRCGLAHNITILIAASPSSVIRFYQTIMDEYSDLVKDIHDGTLRKDVADEIASEERAAVLASFKPDPKRAKELEHLLNTYREGLRLKHFWPDLALVNTWKQGNFAQIIPKLDDYFPEKTVIRAFGYQASEGRAGLVLGNDWDYSVLAAHIYHFEFIEEGQKEDANPTVLQAHEVEVGKRYYILFSNGSGLYRYDINDIVEIAGHYNQLPLFKFIQKGEGVTSLTGEKLSEEQVVQAVKEVSEELSCGLAFYVMFCDEKDLNYKFFVEFLGDVDSIRKENFEKAIDEKLRTLNPEYEVKRGTERLSAPVLYTFKESSYELFKEARIANGFARAGQYKDVYLTKKNELLRLLYELVEKE